MIANIRLIDRRLTLPILKRLLTRTAGDYDPAREAQHRGR